MIGLCRNLLLAAVAFVPQDLLSDGSVRHLRVASAEGTRVQHFRLDGPEGPGAELPIGVVRWVSGPGDAREPGGWISELHVTFFEERTRILHTEELGRSQRELVFREVRPRSGRTHRLVWTPDGRGTSIETSQGEVTRTEHDLSRGAFLPLSLVELLRRGSTLPERARIYRPLAGAFEDTLLTVSEDARGRELQLRTETGGRGRYRIEGDRLVRFAWQDGGPVARVIDETSFERMLENGLEEPETPR